MNELRKQKLIKYIKLFSIPVVFGLIMRYIFFNNSWDLMLGLLSISFLVIVPLVIGIIIVYYSDPKNLDSNVYVIFASIIPIVLLFIIFSIFAVEGIPCLILIAPIYFISSIIGGMLGRKLKLSKINKNINISIIFLLPILIGPIENYIGPATSTYKSYTYIDINSTKEKIWENVVRVSEIDESQYHGTVTKLLWFPRPVKAELNYKGVGAYRDAIFTNGLTFHETVTEYIDYKKMSFTIRANTKEIPLTTMDEHIVVGGKYFDVLSGTYELEKLNEKTYRLHLHSNFKLNTTLNFYSSFWADLIMKDIQNNILKVEKYRAELN